MKLLRIAVRNIRRNRRRTILNVIALAVGLGIALIAFGWINGYQVYIYGTLQDIETGHVQILNREYLDEAVRLPLDLNVPNYTETRVALTNIEGVGAAGGRINFSAKVSHGAESSYLLGRAIDPEAEAEITVLADSIKEGSYLSLENPGILVSVPLAKRFGVTPGDTMFITARDRYDVENLIDARVVGLYELGYPAVDDNIVFFDLITASELLSMEDEVTKIVLRAAPGTAIPELYSRVTESVPDLAVKSWQYFAQVAVSGVQADTASFQIIVVVLILLVVVGILNSMSMSVYERTRELGTLRAIGMKRRQRVGVIIAEAVTIGVLGFLGGVIFSAPAVYYTGWVGFDLTQLLSEGDLEIPFGDRFFAAFTVGHYILTLVIGIVATAAGAWIPARRAARIEVAEAMRTAG